MLFNNPVLHRELVENLRSNKAFVIQAIFIFVLGGVVLVSWPGEMELRDVDDRSKYIYDTFALGQLILLALLAPIFSSPAIAMERERKSIDLLLTTPLPVASIVSGKLLGAVMYLLMLALSSLPIFSVCYMLGAVGPREVMSTYAILFTTALLCGTLGLTASTFMGRSRPALSVSYVVILPAALLMIGLRPMRSIPYALGITIVGLTLTAILLLMVIRRLKQPFDSTPKSADEEATDEQIGLILDQRRFPDNLISPRTTGKPMDETVNPVYVKELRHEVFGRGTLLVRILLQVSMVAALPFFIAALATAGLYIYTSYVLVFIMLLAPSLTAGVFTLERERGTMDLLLTTTIGWRKVIDGKLLVNLRNIFILSGFLLPFLVLIWIFSSDIRERVPLPYLTGGTLAVIASTAVFVVLLSASLSMICRTTLRSMVITYLLLAVLFVMPVIAYGVLTILADVPESSAQWVAITSPFYTLTTFETHDTGSGVGILSVMDGAAAQQLVLYLSFTIGLSAVMLFFLCRYFRDYCQLRHDRGL